MKNEVQFTDTVMAVFALAALKKLTGDPSLPGPIGRDEEPAIVELAQIHFRRLCGELGREASGSSVDLPVDCHELLEAVVTDRVVSQLTNTPMRTNHLDLLRRRLHSAPRRRGARYY